MAHVYSELHDCQYTHVYMYTIVCGRYADGTWQKYCRNKKYAIVVPGERKNNNNKETNYIIIMTSNTLRRLCASISIERISRFCKNSNRIYTRHAYNGTLKCIPIFFFIITYVPLETICNACSYNIVICFYAYIRL